MLKTTLTALAACAALAASATAAQAKPVHYSGQTKEGTKISFRVSHGWVDRIRSRVPSSCVSAQGGTPRVTIDIWQPPYRFKLGYRKPLTVTVEEPWPTRHYTFTSHRHGKRITGQLKLSYAMTVNDDSGGWKLMECYGTASYRAHVK